MNAETNWISVEGYGIRQRCDNAHNAGILCRCRDRNVCALEAKRDSGTGLVLGQEDAGGDRQD